MQREQTKYFTDKLNFRRNDSEKEEGGLKTLDTS